MKYTFDAIKFFVHKKYFWVRDEWNTNKRLKTFIPYLNNQNKDDFLSKLDEKGKKSWKILLEKIEKITYNNILPYKDLFTEEEIQEQQEFAKFCLKNKDNIPFTIQTIWSYLNYFYIKRFSKEYKRLNMQSKDIIDCWWFNGDSSLAMNYYFRNTRKIYCIEPEKNNFNDIKRNIASQQKNNIIPLEFWLWSKKTEATISEWGAWSSLSIQNNTKGNKIKIETIDNIVKHNKINPWLIKRDIEGFEYDSIIWAEQTIKRHKPILIISIYHTGKDRFKILPLIDSRNLWYKFTLRRWNCFHPFADTLLICYQ